MKKKKFLVPRGVMGRPQVDPSSDFAACCYTPCVSCLLSHDLIP